ncbi:MAG: hypothetical protein H0W73_02700 [Bacteroidetes bacterium]|nr:hypothetical protein [Bacteroidota bacterium]
MHKEKLLIFPFDLMSHYLRCIELAKQYKHYEILFAYSKKYNSFVKKAGFGSFNVETFNPVEVMKCAEEFNFSWLNTENIKRVFKSQIKIINELKPDMVIGDTSPTLKMATEACQIKYVALMNGYMSKHYNGVRTLSITHPGYKHLIKLPENVRDFITKFAEKIAFKIVHKPFRKIRKENNLSYVSNYINEMEGDENLLCDEEWLFPQNKLPHNYRFIKPLCYESNDSEDNLISLLDPLKPTVCVCLGSSGNWVALNFLSDKKYSLVNIIVTGDLKQTLAGQHIYHREFANLNAILPKCAFLICHGGNGTIYEGLRHKKYMLCLTSHFEQEWNVQRLSKLNLGTMINNAPEFYINRKIKEVVAENKKPTYEKL